MLNVSFKPVTVCSLRLFISIGSVLFESGIDIRMILSSYFKITLLKL